MDTDVERGTNPEISDYGERKSTVPAQQQQVEDEHDIEKGTRANVLSRKMIRKLDQVPREFRKNFIYRVDDVIRKGHENHYEPILFSIGPHHRGKTNLQSMEEHKWQYLNALVERVTQKTGISRSDLINRCYGVLKKSEDKARGYYADDTTGLNSGEFLEMLLLDGCFLIEMLHKSLNQDEDDPLFNTTHLEEILRHDLLFLLENQLPFFVLERLYDALLPDDEDLDGDELKLSAIKTNIFYVFPAIRPGGRALKDALSTVITACKLYGKDEEILSMIQTVPDLGLIDLEKEVYPDELRNTKHLFDLLYKVLLKEDTVFIPVAVESTLEDGISNLGYISNFSATELRNAGVKFKPVDKEKFYDIQFKNGILEIPTIGITRNTTEGIFRNLIAYEMAGANFRGIISDYVSFMDSLINSGEDVELLRIHGIIEHFLGDDEAVSTMFNNLGTMTQRTSNYYYSDITKQLKHHSGKRRNVWMAKLRSDYFSSPWTIISVIAAFVLLVLTIIQTVYTPISYYNS